MCTQHIQKETSFLRFLYPPHGSCLSGFLSHSPKPSIFQWYLSHSDSIFHLHHCSVSDFHYPSPLLFQVFPLSNHPCFYPFAARFSEHFITYYMPDTVLGILIYRISFIYRRRQWHPTPVLLPGKSHWRWSLVGCSAWGRKESDATERLHFHFSLSCIGEGNGNPLQWSRLENPRDGGAWWATVYGIT